MSHLVLSDDIFLCRAITEIFNSVLSNRRLCIIDIKSYKSLGDLTTAIEDSVASDNYHFIFIGGNCINSKVLEPLVTVNRRSGYTEFRRQIESGHKHTLEHVKKYIEKRRSLKMLTRRERRTAYALRNTKDVISAARAVHQSPKTVYTRSQHIGEKLNLRSTLQVKIFLSTELTKEESKFLLKK